MSQTTARLSLVDALKAVGSQFIVLHHLAFYGPMSDWTHRLWPGLIEWLSRDARMAVQVFLVVSGFLCARALAPDGTPRPLAPARLVGRRYVRIVLPYLAALLVAIVCNEIARAWMTHDTVSGPPGLLQFLAHAALLHSLLGYESLSAGVWYVAIDFQLFVLFVLLLALARTRVLAVVLVAAATLASLFHFNRSSDWDNWALYFFGAYGLGVFAQWVSAMADRARAASMGVAVLLLTLLALWVEWRTRIALALAVAVLLAVAQRGDWLARWPRSRLLGYLGQISYSVFLLNFPVMLVVNAAFTRFAPPDPVVQTLGLLLAWLACNLAGALFYHQVEARLRRVA